MGILSYIAEKCRSEPKRKQHKTAKECEEEEEEAEIEELVALDII